MTEQRVIPYVDDIDTGGFFEAARRGVLAVRRCDGCEAILHMPRAYCRNCRGWEGRWETVEPSGTVFSWTRVTHQVHPAFPTPYTVVLVQLDEHPEVRFVGYLEGLPELAVGQPVAAWFESLAPDVAVPQWKVVE